MENIAAGHPIAAIASGVVVVVHLEHVATNVFAPVSNKFLDVYAIHGRTAIKAPVVAYRCNPLQLAESYATGTRPDPAFEKGAPSVPQEIFESAFRDQSVSNPTS